MSERGICPGCDGVGCPICKTTLAVSTVDQTAAHVALIVAADNLRDHLLTKHPRLDIPNAVWEPFAAALAADHGIPLNAESSQVRSKPAICTCGMGPIAGCTRCDCG